jgi:hypothetical protein
LPTFSPFDEIPTFNGRILMPNVDFSGKWHNEHDSEMELQVAADGRVTGKYQTGVGSPTPSEQFDLVGFAKGDQLSFTVDFSKYGTLTAWVGQHTINKQGAEEINTMWHLSENVPDADEKDKMWNSVTDGADFFWRGPVPPAPTAKAMKAVAKTGPIARPSHPLKRKRK